MFFLFSNNYLSLILPFAIHIRKQKKVELKQKNVLVQPFG
ncbi:hypothetical protein RV17_GL002257 [Enterococcus thailandicus]|nr:hypothetical protein RV17_GL002257 [Enterococcus thailandicus]